MLPPFHATRCVEDNVVLIIRSFSGRGGSPPGSQEALLEATRLTMWKLYNQGLGGGGGFQHEDEGPKLHPPPHHPMGGVPFPPQKEALNLEVKDEVSIFDYPKEAGALTNLTFACRYLKYSR